jgi:transposase
VQAKVAADVVKYAAVFDDASPSPLAVFRLLDGPGASKLRAEVPPASQRLALVVEAHQWGHFGVRKTRERWERTPLWWLGMEDDVRAVVERCVTCQRDAARRTGVFDRVHMDLLQLPESKAGLNYLLLFVDALSKYPIRFALPSKEARGVADRLWSVICTFGPQRAYTRTTARNS